jgi:hypothetical protein
VVPDGRAGEVQGAESQRLVRDALRWCVTHYQGAFDLLELNGADQRQAIVLMIENGPIPAVHGVVRWRLVDLAQCICTRDHVARAASREWDNDSDGFSWIALRMGWERLAAQPKNARGVQGESNFVAHLN